MSTDQTTVAVAKASVREAKLDPWPLEPEQVVEGDPQASGMVLWKSADGKLANGIWECTPGTFTWLHADETLCLVDGKVTVTPEGAEPVDIRPGDVVFFPAGTRTEWRVEETVRKAFHLHSAEGLPF
jgi:uncharacterized cupin superfamily protein